MMIYYKFSKRGDGDMRYADNRMRFAGAPLILAQQVHGTKIQIVQRSDMGMTIPNVDGLIANDAVLLGIRTADCVPIIYYDEKNEVFAAAHSGWRGTYGNISGEILQGMIKLGASRENIQVILGPHIKSCCYSVSDDRAKLFIDKYGGDCVQNGFLSLSTVIKKQLTGVLSVQISNDCTSTLNETYYSYRKETKESFGEQLAIIGLKRVK